MKPEIIRIDQMSSQSSGLCVWGLKTVDFDDFTCFSPLNTFRFSVPERARPAYRRCTSRAPPLAPISSPYRKPGHCGYQKSEISRCDGA